MSARIFELVILVSADDLLGGIWYGDGSGAHCCVPITATPQDYEIKSLELHGEMVKITLIERKEGP